jgi:hypothetical protein
MFLAAVIAAVAGGSALAVIVSVMVVFVLPSCCRARFAVTRVG